MKSLPLAVWCSPPNDWGLSPEKMPELIPRLRTFETSVNEKYGLVYIRSISLIHFQFTFMVPDAGKGNAPVSERTINILKIYAD